VVERAAEARAYHLTDKGRDLAPVLASLAALGTRHCGEPPPPRHPRRLRRPCPDAVLLRPLRRPHPPESLDVRDLD
jgi:hypothetical protein